MRLYKILYIIIFFKTTLTFSQQADSLHLAFLNTKDKSQQVLLLLDIAKQYQSTRLDTALYLAKEALVIAEKEKFKTGIMKARYLTGLFYQQRGEEKEAFIQYQEGLMLSEQLHDTLTIAQIYYALGILNDHARNIKKAEDYFLKSLELFRKSRNHNYEANTLNTLGFFYNKEGKPDTAILLYKQSFELANKINSVKVLSFVSGNLGDIYMKKKDLDSALLFYTNSNQYAENTKNVYGITSSLLQLSNVYFEKGDYKKTEDYLNKIFSYAQKADNATLGNIASAYWIQSEIYRKSNQLHEALKYRDLSRNLADSVENKRQTEAILSLQNTFELDRKQVEIERLKNEKLEQKWLGILLISGLGFILIIALILSFVFWRRSQVLKFIKEQNLKLKEQNEEIHTQSEMLQEAFEEISQLNNVLDEKVKSRTLLLQMQNKKLKEYLFINSHKLRAPLARILGMTDLLRMVGKANIDDEMLTHLTLSAEEVDRIVHEIQEMLEKARVQDLE
jgi:tetratricopeptide (TPR) repeat protein